LKITTPTRSALHSCALAITLGGGFSAITALSPAAGAIDLKGLIPRSVFVREATPQSVAILAISGPSNTSKGMLCDVTYTSKALYPQVTTSKTRCGASRSQLFLGNNQAEVDYDAAMVNLLKLYNISTVPTTKTNGATFVCARPSGVRPSEFSYTLHTTTTPIQGMLLTTSNPQQCWQKS
jgi:hypothetical protein